MHDSWLPRARPLFGKLSDHEIARRVGIPRRTVSQARGKLGIAPAPRIKPKTDPAFIAKATPMFGRVSDNEIARRMGIDVRWIAAARRDAGFAPYGKRPHVTLDHAKTLTIAMLRGTKSAPELSRLTGINAQTIRGRRAALGIPTPKRPALAWVAKAMPMLGKVPDPEIARRVGVSSGSVFALRRRLGIAPVPPRSRALGKALTPTQARLIARDLSPADRVVFEGRFVARPPRSLAEIGRELGVSKQRIAIRERRVLAAQEGWPQKAPA